MSAALLNQDFGSESEGEEFNPAQADDSGNEGGSDLDGKAFPATNGRKKDAGAKGEGGDDDKGNARDDDGLEEDQAEADDDEDEDEEEAISGRPRKRARKDPRNQFLDVEAEVDEEDEGDEDDEEGQQDGFIADTHPDDLVDLPDGTENDDRRHRELDRQRERADQLSAEKQAELLREKYGRRQTTTGDAVHVPKRLLLPSVDDPSVWGVKCKPGKEREVVFAITKRVEDRFGTKDPMPLISAFERGGTMLGYVYIEARKQADVLKALDGIMNVYPRTKVVLVPIKEMPDLLRVTKSEQLQPGSYVRLKRGKYQGDLAQIEDVETNGLEATLRIVPRLDYGANDDAPMIDGGIRGEAAKRKRAGALGLNNAAVRPPPRLFSENEAKKHHSRFLASTGNMDRKTWQYMGDTYVHGFLIKDFKIQHLITENVNPQLEEVTRFTAGAEDGAENLDLTALAATLRKTTAVDNYLPGDMVEVYEGEQSGVSGKAVAVRGDIVTIAVTSGDLRGQSIEVPMKGLRKRFSEGDHVKVIGGSRYKDEVGMVVSIKKDTVTMLSDLSMQEITVFSKDLREASDSGVAGGLGRYDIHDLVQLDPATVGCITKVDRESLGVLDQNGSLRSVMPSQISNKIERRKNAVATDRNGVEIRTDDTVREIAGESKQGVIIHIHRSFLFLHNREQTDNSGISVVRASNVATVAAKGGRVAQAGSTGPDLNKMNPAMVRNGANGNTPMAPPKSFGRDRAIDQTVTIRKGPYKGLLGIVKDTTDSDARVELHTKGKTIQVPKDSLGFKNALTGQSMDYASFAGSRGRGGGGRGGFPGAMGGATPRAQPDWSGGRTPVPMAGGRTPAWGGAAQSARTPAWQGGNSSARTPAWNQGSMGGSRTPAYVSNDGSRTVNPYNDGSSTAYGGATSYGGSRTPAWNPTATASSYTHDPFSTTGSRTPAYSHPTPSNPTSVSRPYDAPTPGKDFASAPTPAASAAARPYADAPTPAASSSARPYDAPTPAANGYGHAASTPGLAGPGGGGMAAPTPKFSGDAPTPFSGLPETPGFGMGAGGGDDDRDDGGPRYEEGTPSP